MLSMTSLVAQSQFGQLITASQRQPVTVTRHGRPIAVVQSYEDYQQAAHTIPAPLAKVISRTHGLRGEPAGAAMRQHLAGMSTLAHEQGLDEATVRLMLNAD